MTTRGRSTGRAIQAILCVTLLFLASTALQATASEAEVTWKITKHRTKLPYAVYRAASVWTGEKEYIMSGRTDQEQVDTIIEFDPSSGKAVVMNARIPTSRVMAAAAWLSPFAYIFGGQNLSTILDDVVRYDPKDDRADVMGYKMPFSRVGMTAVTVGDSILRIGGRNETDYFSTVDRFEPSNGSFVPLSPTPVKGGGRTGIYTGDKVYLFGSCINAKGQDVMELDSTTGVSIKVDAGTPRGFYWSSSAWTGRKALIFGGNDYNTTMDQFLEFTPGGLGLGELRSVGKLPQPIENSAAFYDKDSGKAYILGGRSTTKGLSSIYVVSEDRTVINDVTPERALVVLGLMGFTVLIVAIQSKLSHGKDDETESGNNRNNIPRSMAQARQQKESKDNKKG